MAIFLPSGVFKAQGWPSATRPEMVSAQFRAGLATEIDVIRVRSELETARAEVPALRQHLEHVLR